MSTGLHIPTSPAASTRRRVRPSAVVALGAAAVVTALLLLVTYALAVDYGDTAAPTSLVALRALRGGAVVMALVLALSLVGFAKAGASRGRGVLRGAAVVLVLASVVGTPAAAVLGTWLRFERYPASPSCAEGFRAGPAVPVVRAAQAAFDDVEHPGPFSGGGSSGIDGCETQVMVREGADVLGAYQAALPKAGWRVADRSDAGLRAVKGRQAFEVRMEEYGWVVWVGPRDLRPRAGLADGQVAPRS